MAAELGDRWLFLSLLVLSATVTEVIPAGASIKTAAAASRTPISAPYVPAPATELQLNDPGSEVEYVNDGPLGPLYDFLIRNRLYRFCLLLRKANLESVLVNAGSWTIFAPPDSSFAFLPGGTLEELERNPRLLQEFVLHHFVSGDLASTQITNEMVVDSMQGYPLIFNIYSPQLVTVSGAEILQKDLSFELGRIHVIDRPLYPLPITDIMGYLQTYHNEFYKLILIAELTDFISGGTYTVMAPEDKAFEYLSIELKDMLATNATLAYDIVLLHLIPSTLFVRGISNGTYIQSVSAVDLIFTQRRGLTFVNGIPIVTPDIPLTNGVIHVINRVLLPEGIDSECNCKPLDTSRTTRPSTASQSRPFEPSRVRPGTRVGTTRPPFSSRPGGVQSTPGVPPSGRRPAGSPPVVPGRPGSTGSQTPPPRRPTVTQPGTPQRPGSFQQRPPGSQQRPSGFQPPEPGTPADIQPGVPRIPSPPSPPSRRPTITTSSSRPQRPLPGRRPVTPPRAPVSQDTITTQTPFSPDRLSQFPESPGDQIPRRPQTERPRIPGDVLIVDLVDDQEPETVDLSQPLVPQSGISQSGRPTVRPSAPRPPLAQPPVQRPATRRPPAPRPPIRQIPTPRPPVRQPPAPRPPVGQPPAFRSTVRPPPARTTPQPPPRRPFQTTQRTPSRRPVSPPLDDNTVDIHDTPIQQEVFQPSDITDQEPAEPPRFQPRPSLQPGRTPSQPGRIPSQPGIRPAQQHRPTQRPSQQRPGERGQLQPEQPVGQLQQPGQFQPQQPGRQPGQQRQPQQPSQIRPQQPGRRPGDRGQFQPQQPVQQPDRHGQIQPQQPGRRPGQQGQFQPQHPGQQPGQQEDLHPQEPGQEGQFQPQQPGPQPGQTGQFQPQQPGRQPGQSGQFQPQQPGRQHGQPGQIQPQQPGRRPGQPGHVQPQQPGRQPGQSGQFQPQQPSRQPGQVQPQQPGRQPGQSGQFQPQQPSRQPGQPGQVQPQQPGRQPGQTGHFQPQQPGRQPGQPGQTQPQQPGRQPGQTGQFQPQQPGRQPGQPGQVQPQQPGQFQPQQPSRQPGQTGQFQPQQPGRQPGQPGQVQPHQPGRQPGQTGQFQPQQPGRQPGQFQPQQPNRLGQAQPPLGPGPGQQSQFQPTQRPGLQPIATPGQQTPSLPVQPPRPGSPSTRPGEQDGFTGSQPQPPVSRVPGLQGPPSPAARPTGINQPSQQLRPPPSRPPPPISGSSLFPPQRPGHFQTSHVTKGQPFDPQRHGTSGRIPARTTSSSQTSINQPSRGSSTIRTPTSPSQLQPNCRRTTDRITNQNRLLPLCVTSDNPNDCQRLEENYDPNDPRPICEEISSCRHRGEVSSPTDTRPLCGQQQARQPECRQPGEARVPGDNRPTCTGNEILSPLSPQQNPQQIRPVPGSPHSTRPSSQRVPSSPAGPTTCRPLNERPYAGDRRPLCSSLPSSETPSIPDTTPEVSGQPRQPEQPSDCRPITQRPTIGDRRPVCSPTTGSRTPGSQPQRRPGSSTLQPTSGFQTTRGPSIQTGPRFPGGQDRNSGNQDVIPEVLTGDDFGQQPSPVQTPGSRSPTRGFQTTRRPPSQNTQRISGSPHSGLSTPAVEQPSIGDDNDLNLPVPNWDGSRTPGSGPASQPSPGSRPASHPSTRPSTAGHRQPTSSSARQPGSPSPTGSRPGSPSPTGSRPGSPLQTGSRPGSPSPTGSRPGLPSSAGTRPGSLPAVTTSSGTEDGPRSLYEIVQDPALLIQGQPVKLTKIFHLFQIAGLDYLLLEPGPYTVFLPSDDAFSRLPKGVVEQLESNPDLLRDILLFHIVTSEVLPSGTEESYFVPSLQGNQVLVTMSQNGKLIIISGAKAVAVTRANNGIFYVINQLLYPLPQDDIVSALKNRPDLSQMSNYIEIAGLEDVLRGDQPYTIFAPTDEAFSQLPEGALQALAQNTTALQALLLGHVIEGAHYGREFLLGKSFQNIRGGKLKLGVVSFGYQVNDINIKTPEIVTGSGVIHVIENLLLTPQDLIFFESFQNTINDVNGPSSQQTHSSLTGQQQQQQGPQSPSTINRIGSVSSPGRNSLTSTQRGTTTFIMGVRSPTTTTTTSHQQGGQTITTHSQHSSFGHRSRTYQTSSSGSLSSNNPVRAGNLPVQGVLVHAINQSSSQPNRHSSQTFTYSTSGQYSGGVAQLANDIGLRKFAEYLKSSGLSDKIEDGGSYTVFAPTDEALNSLPPDLVGALDAAPEQVMDLLRYHVLPQKLNSDSLRNDETASTLLQGSKLRFNVYHGGQVVTALGVPVERTEEDSSPVRLIIVDRVLQPPSGNLLQIIESHPELTEFAKAIKNAHLSWMLSGEGGKTLFAPSNVAFQALTEDQRKQVIENKQAFTEFLKSHILRGTIFTSGFQDGDERRTENNKIVVFNVYEGGVSVNSVPIVYSDITATNGVVHIIDQFL